MPYADRWQVVITKEADGIYTVSRGGPSLTVAIDQIFPTETLNEAAALFRAIQRIFPNLQEPWASRYAYAVARWKLAAYQSLIDGSSGAVRTALRAKRDVWVAEELRIRTSLGSDA